MCHCNKQKRQKKCSRPCPIANPDAAVIGNTRFLRLRLLRNRIGLTESLYSNSYGIDKGRGNAIAFAANTGVLG